MNIGRLMHSTVPTLLLIFLGTLLQANLCCGGAVPVSNAAEVYRRASQQLHEASASLSEEVTHIIKNGWMKENAEVRDHLRRNSEALASFKEATRIESCQFPELDQESSEKGMFGPLISAIESVMLEAQLFESEKRVSEALSNYASAARFAKHFCQQKQSLLKHRSFAMAMKLFLLRPLKKSIVSLNAQAADYRKLMSELIELKKADTGLLDVMKDEAERALRMSEKAIEMGEILKHDSKKWKKYQLYYLKHAAEIEKEYLTMYAAAIKENDPGKCREQTRFLLDRYVERKDSFIFFSALNEAVGQLFYWPDRAIERHAEAVARVENGLKPDYSNLITMHYNINTELDLCIVAIGVRLYEIRNHEPPDRLTDLVPDYLADVPSDPFNGFSQMKYFRKEKEWVAYSCGPDKKDDSGEMVDPRTWVPKGTFIYETWKGDIVIRSKTTHLR